MNDVLAELAKTLEARKQADPDESYVASLHHKGLNKILEKIGEEATEAIIAAKDLEHGGSREELVGEVADLWFDNSEIRWKPLSPTRSRSPITSP